MQAEWPQTTTKLVLQFSKAFLSLLFSAPVNPNSTSTPPGGFLHLCPSAEPAAAPATSQLPTLPCPPHQPLATAGLGWAGAPSLPQWPLPAPDLDPLLPVLTAHKMTQLQQNWPVYLKLCCAQVRNLSVQNQSVWTDLGCLNLYDTRQLQNKYNKSSITIYFR